VVIKMKKKKIKLLKDRVTYMKEYREKNKKRISELKRKWNLKPINIKKKNEYMKEYNQKLGVKKHRKEYNEEWRSNNKEKLKEYRELTEVKESHNKRQKHYRSQNPEKIKAQNMASYYLKIPKGQLCVRCNKRLAKHKHHEDYNKPLEVIFVCDSCHKQIHNTYSSCENCGEEKEDVRYIDHHKEFMCGDCYEKD